ncbi:MAG: efflux RND transporter permease subunit [Bacteroidia bacterium]
MKDWIFISRPLGLITLSLALACAGAVAVNFLNTSLLPERAAPLLEVRIHQPGFDAVYMETQLSNPLRAALAPMSGLVSMESTCESGDCLLTLHFSRDADMETARQEASDRVDQAIESGIAILNRPEIRLPTLTDLPVMYLYLQVEQDPGSVGFEDAMMALSQWAKERVSQRLEQQPDIGTVEIAGLWVKHWEIIPDDQALLMRGIHPSALPGLIQAATPDPVQIELREGYRSRPVQIFSSQFLEPDSILIRTQNASFFLGEVASIQQKTEPQEHQVFLDGSPALCFALLQRSGANLSNMSRQVAAVCEELSASQARVRFVTTRDQTEILELAIQNMWQGLLLSIFMAGILFFLFMRQGLAALLIGLSVGVALCWTLGTFWGLDIGINSLSLAGLVIGIGLMVDNAIILLNQIRLLLEDGFPLAEAIGKSVSDLALPLATSTATTIVVFIPLRAGGDTVNALFSEQAISMSISLSTSFLVTLVLIPPVYFLLAKRFPRMTKTAPARFWINTQKAYKNTLSILLHRPGIAFAATIGVLALGLILMWRLPHQLFPTMERKQLLVRFFWPEDTSIDRMKQEMEACVEHCGTSVLHSSMHMRQQPFLRDPDPLKPNESELLLEFTDGNTAHVEAEKIQSFLSRHEGMARWRIAPMPTPFEYLFTHRSDLSDLRGYLPNNTDYDPAAIELLRQSLSLELDIPLVTEEPLEGLIILPDPGNLSRAGLSVEELLRQLKWSLGESFQIKLAGTTRTISQSSSFGKLTPQAVAAIPIVLPNRSTIPLHTLAKVLPATKFARVHADEHGVFIPFYYPASHPLLPQLKEKIAVINHQKPELFLSFSPPDEKSDAQLRDLVSAILLSVVMLFLILAAQFESFGIPLVILLEIPVVMAGTAAMLFFCGQTLNLMSLIGLIVMMGIIINDSILKLDVIQKRRREGFSAKDAVLQGSTEKVSSVVLTSLTTMASTFPFLWSDDLGSQLQRPFALVLGGGIGIGLLVTLFLVPVWTFAFSRKNPTQSTPTHYEIKA